MEEAISPYATEARAGASSTRWRRGSLRATAGPSNQVDASGAERDEERPDDVADAAAAGRDRPDDDREAEQDHQQREPERHAVVPAHGPACGWPMTFPLRHRRSRRLRSSMSSGKPTLMPPPALRRTASSTIARPEFRARTMRVMTFTP